MTGRLSSALAVCAMTVACASVATKPAPHEALPFIADDYARALAEAKARHLPLFIEGWAPW